MTFRQQYLYGKGPIELNAGRRTLKVTVSNTGDRAVQIGSHYHFFEVNSALSFDRQKTLGMHLNIAAGTSVRFEPGGSREVELCAYAGTGRLTGFSGLLNGSLASHPARVEAVRKAIEQGFAGAQGTSGATRSASASGRSATKGSKDTKNSKDTKDTKSAKSSPVTKKEKKGSR
ncbi:urease subunit beta [Streptomyces sp. MNU77]|uniref:urease subunit beta n=1 Tax=Streptomyces sp. MNU77 TaxID=1573406 RepID=UPI0005E4626D|nr:urease subunit beta [Streptomyces sp. MNU77]OLO29605.1 urease subunit beta [Streptomyces sp. MNU77]